MAETPSMLAGSGGMGGVGRRKRLYFVNWPVILSVAALTIYGLIVVSSAVAESGEYSIRMQFVGVAVGVVAMTLIWNFDYRKLHGLIVPLLVLDVILLLSPHFPLIGLNVNGATSWIQIGPVRGQPGELAKPVTIVLIAAMISQYNGVLDSGREYIKACAICAVPFLCIMTQPDLGTGLVIIVISATILFVGGANRKWLLITIAIVVAVIAFALAIDPVLDNAAGKDVFLKDYQMNRLLVFIDPTVDPTGAGYNLNQAKIAVGSGGLFGKGLGNGTQSAMGFLPEAPTDFIFCVVGEDLGFFGAVVLLSLYLVLMLSSISVASHSDDLFGTLIVAGVVGMWVFQVLENIGMDLGLMPITGIPLPFMSYGSSFMLCNFMTVGLVLSVWKHRSNGEFAKDDTDASPIQLAKPGA